MPFEFQPQTLDGVVLIRPRVFGDASGFFLETFKRSEFEAAGIHASFVQDNHSYSQCGVVRGIHYQLPPRSQGKLVHVVEGTIWDVCVDLRRDSPTFGRWLGVTLDSGDPQMLYVPPGYGHGFAVLSESAHFLYKCTDEYAPEAEAGVRWDDPNLAIDWPVEAPCISAKDAELPLLQDARVFEERPA